MRTGSNCGGISIVVEPDVIESGLLTYIISNVPASVAINWSQSTQIAPTRLSGKNQSAWGMTFISGSPLMPMTFKQ